MNSINGTHLSHFIPAIQNFEVSVETLKEAILETMEKAKNLGETQVIGGFAGMYDILVSPAGYIRFVPTVGVTTYVLKGDLLVPDLI